MPIKIKTSFLFKNRKSRTPNKENLSKNTSLKNEEDDSPFTSPKSLKDEPRGTKRKQDFSEDSDNTSSGENSSFESEFNEDSLSDSPPIENEGLKRREENIKARDAYLASFMNDPEFAEAVEKVGIFKKKDPPLRKSIKRRKTDKNFYTSCQIPCESRKSLRLRSKEPQFTYQDLPDDSTFASLRKRKNYDSDDDLANLEEIVYKPKIKRTSSQRNSGIINFLPVEDVTDSMLKKIARRVVEKEYSIVNGTSCHQCRQKTTDTKTFCRSQGCGGVKGQFCGVCLSNR